MVSFFCNFKFNQRFQKRARFYFSMSKTTLFCSKKCKYCSAPEALTGNLRSEALPQTVGYLSCLVDFKIHKVFRYRKRELKGITQNLPNFYKFLLYWFYWPLNSSRSTLTWFTFNIDAFICGCFEPKSLH